jgi:hypothetical protein
VPTENPESFDLLEPQGPIRDSFTFAFVIHSKLKIVVVKGILNAHSLTSVYYS